MPQDSESSQVYHSHNSVDNVVNLSQTNSQAVDTNTEDPLKIQDNDEEENILQEQACEGNVNAAEKDVNGVKSVSQGEGISQEIQNNTNEEEVDEHHVKQLQNLEVIVIEDSDTEIKPLTRKRKRIRKPDPVLSLPCPHCGKVLKSKIRLTYHIRTHTGERPYICEECGQGFYQPGHLADHKLGHTNIKNFQCNQCDKAFHRKFQLQRHEATHTGEKPYSCEICLKSFAQKTNMVMHMKVHTNDRPHKCTECDKSFITKSKLMVHTKKHLKKFLMAKGESFDREYFKYLEIERSRST